MMIVRVVTIEVAAGKEDQFRHMGRSEVIPTNQRFGALDCYVLEPTNGSRRFGILSTWQSVDDLNEMRADSRYRDLLSRAGALASGALTDDVYHALVAEPG